MRDPRIDPQPGDVLKSQGGSLTYTIVKRDGDLVTYSYVCRSLPDTTERATIRLRSWTDMSDEVVSVAGNADGKWEMFYDNTGRPAAYVHSSGLWYRAGTLLRAEEVSPMDEAAREAVAQGKTGEHVLSFERVVKATLRKA